MKKIDIVYVSDMWEDFAKFRTNITDYSYDGIPINYINFILCNRTTNLDLGDLKDRYISQSLFIISNKFDLEDGTEKLNKIGIRRDQIITESYFFNVLSEKRNYKPNRFALMEIDYE